MALGDQLKQGILTLGQETLDRNNLQGRGDWRSRIGKQEGPTTMALAGEEPVYVETRDPRYLSDAYQYYMQGMDRAATGAPAAPIVQDPMAGDAQVASQIAAQDRGAGITGASAIQPPISDPFLASGAAGGARLPPMDQAGAVAAMTQPEAYSLPGESDPFLASGAAGGARLPTTPIGPRTTLPSGDVFAGGDYSDVAGTLGDPTEKMDYTEKTPTQWEALRDKFV